VPQRGARASPFASPRIGRGAAGFPGARVECAVTSAASTTRCPASRDVDPRARTGWSTVGHNAASRRVHHAAVTRHGRQGGSNSKGGSRPDVVSPGNRGCWWSQRKQGVASPTGSLCLFVTEGSAGRGPRRPHPPKRPDPLPSSFDGAASLLPEHRRGGEGVHREGFTPRYRAGQTPLPEGATGVEAPLYRAGPSRAPGSGAHRLLPASEHRTPSAE
jgi:hypothetical protein